jgi:hypothetical protein
MSKANDAELGQGTLKPTRSSGGAIPRSTRPTSACSARRCRAARCRPSCRRLLFARALARESIGRTCPAAAGGGTETVVNAVSGRELWVFSYIRRRTSERRARKEFGGGPNKRAAYGFKTLKA